MDGRGRETCTYLRRLGVDVLLLLEHLLEE